MAVEVLYIENDNLLELDGLQNAATDAYVNGATVTVTLRDQEGTAVTGQTWPATMYYVANSNGKYRATLEDVLSLTSRKRYTAEIDADGGAGLKGHWEFPLKALKRTTQSA